MGAKISLNILQSPLPPPRLVPVLNYPLMFILTNICLLAEYVLCRAALQSRQYCIDDDQYAQVTI